MPIGIRFLSIIIFCGALLFSGASFAAPQTKPINQPSIALYYGQKPPVDLLRAYDYVIFSQDAKFNLKKYVKTDSTPLVYVSVGEVGPKTLYRKQIKSSWLIGENKIWKSRVLDQTNPAWQRFFINKIITPLWQKGYRGFFLDTLDSYQLAVKTPAGRAAQIKAMEKLIQLIKTKYPKAVIILNRGFELLPAIHDKVFAVGAESLYHSWNESKKIYQHVSPI